MFISLGSAAFQLILISFSQLEHQLESQEAQHAISLRSVRNVDRTVRDLQTQLSRRDQSIEHLHDDVSKGRDKIERLLQQIDELQAEDAESQLQARRAERDLREEREKGLRLERELEGWKGLRMERGQKSGSSGGSEWGAAPEGGVGTVKGRTLHAHRESEGDGDLQRTMSDSKGFL